MHELVSWKLMKISLLICRGPKGNAEEGGRGRDKKRICRELLEFQLGIYEKWEIGFFKVLKKVTDVHKYRGALDPIPVAGCLDS